MIIDVPTTPTSLQSIMQKANPYGTVLYLQAVEANTVNVNFGPKDECDLFIAPGLSTSYPAISLSSVYVSTTIAAQKLIVIFNKA